MTRMILEEDQGETADQWHTDMGTRAAGKAKLNALFQGAVMFFIILGAFIAIAVLVDSMTWMH
jgi:hypothetical protein